MAYIGKNPTTGSFIYADDITTSSTNTYNILVGGVAFSPESANHCIVSLNGVIQKANTSFSISGSQITFLPSSGTLSSSDSIDFLLILGSVNNVGVATTVSDQAITKTKTNFVSSGTGYTGTGLDIKGNGSANGRLGLLCSAGSHGVALESPDHSSAQSYTIQLPSNSPTVDKFIKVTSLTGSGATAIAHTQFADAGGGLVLIKEVAASNVSAVTFVHGTSDVVFDTTYKAYLFVFSQVIMAGDEEIFLRATISGSPQTSSYVQSQYGGYLTSNKYLDHYTNSFFGSPGDVDAAIPMSGFVYFYGAGGTSIYPQAMGQVINMRSNNDNYMYNFGSYRNSTTSNFDGFTFTNNGGPNITSGNFKLYGLK